METVDKWPQPRRCAVLACGYFVDKSDTPVDNFCPLAEEEAERSRSESPFLSEEPFFCLRGSRDRAENAVFWRSGGFGSVRGGKVIHIFHPCGKLPVDKQTPSRQPFPKSYPQAFHRLSTVCPALPPIRAREKTAHNITIQYTTSAAGFESPADENLEEMRKWYKTAEGRRHFSVRAG